ncbi:hypothetical protein GCM10027160_29400 [Streptomyces calidiresistens]|uniref:Uncharacterized protein n=1 Tax=Streptomyces calidiresistens TaxID=1485586 RepID=A0A7W3T1B0_9ACTN|nr:hypothetical protein [Streptomyces calidiresistens]MBB0229139.1 hypothetical protein [Streptomyces calidiresistens]
MTLLTRLFRTRSALSSQLRQAAAVNATLTTTNETLTRFVDERLLDLNTALEDAHHEIEQLRAAAAVADRRATRYRLAWISARQRAGEEWRADPAPTRRGLLVRLWLTRQANRRLAELVDELTTANDAMCREAVTRSRNLGETSHPTSAVLTQRPTSALLAHLAARS